eukprot:TRINITY_DN895_c0_g1_i2.p1 TRINITY_DN895_c0_g1~~TRINITY_DN895_c0_g1_i2.p1  ORF type:complete len:521 (-),score=58.04 TRINITY_DN895_c0_g1_i2:67-1629(-)
MQQFYLMLLLIYGSINSIQGEKVTKIEWTDYSYVDGIYTGDWDGDMPNGQGEFEGSDGSYYTGSWSYGSRHGQGYSNDSRHWYKGGWKWDSKDGQGTYYNRRENKEYKGRIEQGKWSGYGEMEWKEDGRKYSGFWKDDVRHGNGEFITPLENTKVKAVWENDKEIKRVRFWRRDGWTLPWYLDARQFVAGYYCARIVCCETKGSNVEDQSPCKFRSPEDSIECENEDYGIENWQQYKKKSKEKQLKQLDPRVFDFGDTKRLTGDNYFCELQDETFYFGSIRNGLRHGLGVYINASSTISASETEIYYGVWNKDELRRGFKWTDKQNVVMVGDYNNMEKKNRYEVYHTVKTSAKAFKCLDEYGEEKECTDMAEHNECVRTEDKEQKYEGDCVDYGKKVGIKKNGHGKVVTASGSYEGSFKLDTKNGFGYLNNTLEDSFLGEFIWDKKQGFGMDISMSERERCVYMGKWEKNRVQNGPCAHVYIREKEDGKLEFETFAGILYFGHGRAGYYINGTNHVSLFQ